MSLAEPGQILLTRGVFDNARQVLKGQDINGLSPLVWLNHGPYLLKGFDETVEICEAGESDLAPLRPPPDSEKVHRHISPDSEPVLGWRPAVDQLVPKTQWRLETKLGEGGFGEVWLGRHEMLKHRRVFKFCFRADRVRSLRREVTLFRLLKERVGDHPNIVGVQEVYFDEPPFYIMMDYAEGLDLRASAESQGGLLNVPLPSRLKVAAQVADALQAAHDAGIIHRDVKPSNVLVSNQRSEVRGQMSQGSDQGAEVRLADSTSRSHKSSPPSPVSPRGTCHPPPHVKLTDFGIGQVVSEELLSGLTSMGFTQTMMISPGSSSQSGTQMYMAPELLAGQQASPQSDIYSLGVVLYQLTVGSFSRPLTTDWLVEISDPLIREDLAKCLAGDPKKRFVRAGALAASLRSFAKRQHALDQMRDAIIALGEMRSALIKAEIKTDRFSILKWLAVASLFWWVPVFATKITLESVDRVFFEMSFRREHNRYLLFQDAFLDLAGQSSNWIGAVENIEEAIEQLPKESWSRRDPVLAQLAETLMKKGRLEEAYQVVTKAIANYPGDRKPRELRAKLLLRMHYEDAAAADTYFAKLHPFDQFDFAVRGNGGHFIDLRPYCTASLAESRLLGVSKNNLGLVQKLSHRMAGVEFEIRGALQLAGGAIREYGWHFPPRINGIRIGKSSPRIHFLHGCGHVAPVGAEIGSYVVHYVDGDTTDVPLVYGVSVRNWWVNPDETSVGGNLGGYAKNDRQAPGQKILGRPIDELELRILIGMAGSLSCLAIGLHAVVQLIQ